MEPIAYVDPTGYVTPITSKEAVKHVAGGRFIYTQSDLKAAMDNWDKSSEERARLVAEKGDGVVVSTTFDEESGSYVVEEPAMQPVTTADNVLASKNNAVTKPGQIPAPPSIHVPQSNVNLTPEELAELHGIDAQAVEKEMFGDNK